MVEPCRSKDWSQDLVQAVILAVRVFGQSPVSLLDRHGKVDLRRLGEIAEIAAGV